jgi:hypothetical protein
MSTPVVSKRFLRALSRFEQLLQCPIWLVTKYTHIIFQCILIIIASHQSLNKAHTAMECGHNFC